MTQVGESTQLEPAGRRGPSRPAPVLSHWYVRVVVVAAFVLLDLVALGFGNFSERVGATALSTVVPGFGLWGDYRVLSILFLVAVPVLLVAWLRWGTDWLLLGVWAAAPVLTFILFPTGHVHPEAVAQPRVFIAAHEVTWVMAVFALVYWIGLYIRRIPIVDRLLSMFQRPRPQGLAALPHLPVVERARAIGFLGLAHRAGADVPLEEARAALQLPDVRKYARRVALAGRARFGGNPLARDHAHIRAARLLVDEGTPREAALAAAEAERSSLAAIPSEPGWVRLVDSTLMCAALAAHGHDAAVEAWRGSLDEWFALHKGKRPSSRHTALGFAPFNAQPWEHAAAGAVLLAHGWIDPEPEWQTVKRQALGAVGRGGRVVVDKRAVAAGRCWAVQVGDEDTLSLLARISPATNDPIAVALEALAVALEQNPLALRAGRAA